MGFGVPVKTTRHLDQASVKSTQRGKIANGQNGKNTLR